MLRIANKSFLQTGGLRRWAASAGTQTCRPRVRWRRASRRTQGVKGREAECQPEEPGQAFLAGSENDRQKCAAIVIAAMESQNALCSR